MAENTSNAKNNTAMPIDSERCTPGGLAGVDAMDWALRAGLAMLAIAIIWSVIVVFKPLPSGQAQQPPQIPTLAAMPEHAAPIDVREARLAELNAGGNFFASDRNNWPVHVARKREADPEATPGRSQPQGPTVVTANNQDIDSIELADNAPSAIKKRLDQLKLRGVYVANGEPSAMIGKKTNASSESYRVGDTFDDGEWRLVAIDEVSDRVILNRSGLNFELKLYDTGTNAYANASPRTSISATNATGEVEIGFTSLDKVATQLREAGVPRDQINDLISLAQADPDEEEPAVDASVEATEDAKPRAIPPAMPPGMVQLFRAMAEGSREVVTPAPATAPATEDNAKADEKAQDKSSDKSDEDS
jgi:hypothetical protein